MLLRIIGCFIVLSLALLGEVQAFGRHRPHRRQHQRPHAARVVPLPPSDLRPQRGVRFERHHGVDVDYLPYIREEYAEMIRFERLWGAHRRRCEAYETAFLEAARLTGYSRWLVMAIPFHESHCDAAASDWAHGQGIMQLTGPGQNVYARPVARVLRRAIRWRTRPLDHVLVGIMHLAWSERRYHDLGYALLGYNLSPEGVARYITRWRRIHRQTRRPTLGELATVMPCIGGSHGRCPQRYPARVLAAAIFANRAERGVEQTTLPENFPLSSIPGATLADNH